MEPQQTTVPDKKSRPGFISKKDWFNYSREQLKPFWTRADAHRWGEDWDLDPNDENPLGFGHPSHLRTKYGYAINSYLRLSDPMGLVNEDDLPTTPRKGDRLPEREMMRIVLNYWHDNNRNEPAQFRSIAEYDEFVALNEKRKRYHQAFEDLGGKWGIHFARSIYDEEEDQLRDSKPYSNKNRFSEKLYTEKQKKLYTGRGLFDWMKTKYQSHTQPVQQPRPQPVIIPPNQPLPPEIPSTNILQQIASNAYKESPQPVEGFNLLHQTPTVKFYQSSLNAKLYVFGIRGTVVSDKQDRSADLSLNEGIVGNNLKRSARYQKDKSDIEAFLTRYNVNDSDFIVGAAHSLGGALCDELLHDGLIDYAVSFNPAVQPKDIGFTQFHRRIYLDKDPLYQTMARNNVKNNIEVRQTKQTTGSNILGAVNKNLGTLWQTKGAHSIDNFVGGKKQVGLNQGERHYDEDRNVWIGGSCMCPKNYEPVIGKDGKTYNNKCQASCAERTFDETENRWAGGAQYFSFYKPDSRDLMFAQELQPQRCNFILKNRNLCKRTQNIGTEYCFQHLPSYMKLKIKETNDGRGKGVFVVDSRPQQIVFKKGDIIAKYNGEEIDGDELVRRYGEFTAPYAYEAEEDFIDAAILRGVGAMINAVKPDEIKNCIVETANRSGDAEKIDVWNELNPRDTVSQNDLVVIANKNIKAGTQLLLDYGNAYRFEDSHTTGTKKPKETHGINIKNGFYAAPNQPVVEQRAEQGYSAAEQPVVKQRAKNLKQTNTKRKRTRISYDEIKTAFGSENDVKRTNIKCFFKIPMNLWVAPFLAGLQNYIGAPSQDFATVHTGYWGGYEEESDWDVNDNVLPIINTIDLYMTPAQSKMKTDAFLKDKSHMYHPNQSGELMTWDEIAEEVKRGIGDKLKAILFCVNIQPFDPQNIKGQNHSGLLIYDREEKTLSFYDPMGAEMGNHELNQFYKKNYYNKAQLEKYHGIFKKIALKLACAFRTSYDTHNGQLLGFQAKELNDSSIKNGCMWWCFYMYNTVVNVYADDDTKSMEDIIDIHYETREDIVLWFKEAVFRMVNMINKEVENQNIAGVSSPFIPKETNTEERDKQLIEDSVKVAKFYGKLQE